MWCDDQGGGDGDTTHVSFLAPAPPLPLGISPPPRTLPTSSVKGHVHTLLLDRRLRSYPSSDPLSMRISMSTGLPEPHPDEHEPFNKTGSPLSAGVSLVLPLPCSSSLLAPPKPRHRGHWRAITLCPPHRPIHPQDPTDCTSSYVLLFNRLQPGQLPTGEERHIYISGKTDPCTSPVRSQNPQKAGRKQV